MPTYSEVFQAKVAIGFTDFEQVMGQLRAIEEQSVKTARVMQTAFSQAFQELDTLGRAKVFGEGLQDIIGARGGFRDLGRAQVQELAAMLDELSRISSVSIGQVASEMREMAVQVGQSSGVSADYLREFLFEVESVGQIVQIIQDLGGGVNDEVMGMVSGLSDFGGRLLRVLVTPFEEAYDAIVGHSIVSDLQRESVGGIQEAVAGMNAAMRGLMLEEEMYTSAQAFQAAGLDIGRISKLIEGDFQSLGQATAQMAEGIRLAADQARNVMSGFGEISKRANELRASGMSVTDTFKQLRQEFDLVGGMQVAIGGVQHALEPVGKTVDRVRQAMRLVRSEGGSAFQALRYMIFDAAEAPNALVQIFDNLIARVRSSRSSFTALQSDLMKAATAGSKYADGLRTASQYLKDLETRHGGLRRELSAVEKMLNTNQRAWNVLANSAEASGRVTDRQLADTRRSIIRTREEIDRLIQTSKQSPQPLDPATLGMLEQYKKALMRQEQQLKNVQNVQNAVTNETRHYGEELDRSSGALNKSRGLLGQLVDKIKAIFGGTKDNIQAMGDYGGEVNYAAMQVSGLTRAFLMADLAGRAISAGFRAIMNAVRSATYAITGFISEAFGLSHVSEAIHGIFSGFVDLAARVETLGDTMKMLGKNAGISLEYLNKKVQELRESGITTAGAMQSITYFMSQKLPLDRIGELSRAAQDMAVAFGTNSTEAFQRFTESIISGTTELLDIFGVENASLMFERYAKSIDKTTNSLTNAEKQQAIFNGILQAAEPYAGAYMSAMDTVGKKMGSLARKLEEASLELGKAFLPVLSEVVDRIGKFADDFGAMVVEIRPHLDALAIFMKGIVSTVADFITGVVLPAVASASEYLHVFIFVAHQLGETVSALFSGDFGGALSKLKNFLLSVVAMFKVAFGGLIADAVDWGRNIVSNLYDGLKRFLMEGQNWFSQAFQWGYSFIVELTNGIISAANSILIHVLEFIGNLIASFLAPGSPPERGPLSTIGEWGGGLMQEIADDMAAVDPSVFAVAAGHIAAGLAEGIGKSFRDLELSSFQALREAFGIAQTALQSLVGLGQIDESKLVPELQKVRDLMVDLYNIFEDTGQISEETLAKIGDRFGDQKDDIEEYLRLQLQLQKAQQELADLDTEIAAAEQAGFVSTELREKRAAKASEIESLAERFQLQKEILDFQKQGNDLMIQQMNLLERMAKAMEKQAAAAEKAQKDPWEAFLEQYDEEMRMLETKKELGLITEEEYMKGRLSLEERYIDTAIRLNKPLTTARIQAFKDLQVQVEKLTGRGGGKGGIGELDDATNRLWEDFINGLGESKVQANDLAEMLEDGIGGSLNRAVSKFMRARIQIEDIFGGLSFKFELPAGIQKFGILARTYFARLPEAIDKARRELGDFVGDVANIISDVADGIVGFVTSAIHTITERAGIGRLLEALGGLAGRLISGIKWGIEHLGEVFQRVFGAGGDADDSVNHFRVFMEDLGVVVGTLVDTVATALAIFIELAGPALETVLKLLFTVAGLVVEVVAGAISIGVEIGKGIRQVGGLLESIGDFLDEVNASIGDTISDVMHAIGLGTLAGGIGDVKDALDGVDDIIGQIARGVAILGTVVGGFLLIKSAVLGLVGVMTVLSASAAPAFFSAMWKIATVTTNARLAMGAYALAIGATIAAAAKFKEVVIDMEQATEGTEKAKDAMETWSDSAKDMRKEGMDVTEIVDKFADKMRFTYEQFEKAGALTDVLARGKDIEIYKKSTEEMTQVLVEQTETYDEYLQMMMRYNDQLPDQAMRLDVLTESQYNVEHSLRGVTDETERARITLAKLAEGEGFAAGVARALITTEGALAQETEDSAIRRSRAHGMARQSAEQTEEVLDKRAQGHKDRAAALEAEIKAWDGLIGMYGQAGSEVSRLLEEQTLGEQEYRDERERLLREGNTEELTLLNARYAEEARARRAAIATALLDLNEQIMKEKLMREGITGAEAAVVVEQHRKQAVEIAEHYGLPIKEAQTMGDVATSALRQAALANTEFLENVKLKLPEALDLFELLETEGYENLEATAQEKIQLMIGALATMPEEIRPSMDEIAGIISVLPASYQTALLEMLDANATIDEIIAAFRELDGLKASPEVEMKIKKTGAAGTDLALLSPKTQMQEALESLVAYASDHAVEVTVALVGDTIETIAGTELAITTLIATVEALMFKAENMKDKMSRAVRDVEDGFRRAMNEIRRVSEETMSRIVKAARDMQSAVMGIAHALRAQFVDAMHRMGREAAAGFVAGLSYIQTELYTFFIGGAYSGLDYKFFMWGMEMMEAFANGIRYGKTQYVEKALAYVASQMPSSEPKTGPLAFTPDWSYLTEGLRGQANVIDGVMRNFERRNYQVTPSGELPTGGGNGKTYVFQRGAFENAFPNIQTESDAAAMVRTLNELTERGIAFSKVGGF